MIKHYWNKQPQDSELTTADDTNPNVQHKRKLSSDQNNSKMCSFWDSIQESKKQKSFKEKNEKYCVEMYKWL